SGLGDPLPNDPLIAASTQNTEREPGRPGLARSAEVVDRQLREPVVPFLAKAPPAGNRGYVFEDARALHAEGRRLYRNCPVKYPALAIGHQKSHHGVSNVRCDDE